MPETQTLPFRVPKSAPEQTSGPSLSKGQRVPALDFTKGALVLIMVLYHWINYFVNPMWKYLCYLRFLTPSFICISGFMVSHIYLSKYSASDTRLTRRLMTRGAKLLAIFLVLNLARDVVVPILGSGAAARYAMSPTILIGFFVFGNLPEGGAKLVSFPILVPISYLLVGSGALMLLYRRFKYTFAIACLSLLVASLILEYVGTPNYNLEYVCVGMLGLLAGFWPINRLGAAGKRPYLLALAYLGYLIAISLWGVPFLLMIIAVPLNLTVLYLFGAGDSEASVMRHTVIMLGKYSLLGYIAQVAILQLLSRGSHRVDLGAPLLPISLVAAVTLTILAVEFVDRVRAKSRRADWIYRAIFA